MQCICAPGASRQEPSFALVPAPSLSAGFGQRGQAALRLHQYIRQVMKLIDSPDDGRRQMGVPKSSAHAPGSRFREAFSHAQIAADACAARQQVVAAAEQASRKLFATAVFLHDVSSHPRRVRQVRDCCGHRLSPVVYMPNQVRQRFVASVAGSRRCDNATID
jgi:hypothetical protein